MESTSRIYIRGLPPSLSIEDFRHHFSHVAPITDAKFMPQRRIGYVGYRTPEDALRAVKYHNKTFIRMSRTNVELAKSVEAEGATRPKTKRLDEQKSTHYTNGTLRPAEGRKATQKRPAEASQPHLESSSQVRIDLTASKSEPRVVAPKDPQEEAIQAQSNAWPRKRTKLDHDSAMSQDTTEGVEAVQNSEGTPEGPVKVAATDEDWLRSRTNRILDLVQDENELSLATSRGPQSDTEHNIGRVELDESVDNHSLQTTAPDDVSDSAPRAHGGQGNEREAPNGEAVACNRLFLRNMSYEATDDDVRNFIEQAGCESITEVGVDIF